MKEITKYVFLIVLGLTVLVFFASTYPDGLERVAESLGIAEPEPVWIGLMPDYSIHVTKNPYLTTLVSGYIGIFLVFILAWGIGWATSKKVKKNA